MRKLIGILCLVMSSGPVAYAAKGSRERARPAPAATPAPTFTGTFAPLYRAASTVRTLADWHRVLTTEQRTELLGDLWFHFGQHANSDPRPRNLRTTGPVKLGQFRSPRMATIAKALHDEFMNAMPEDIVDDEYHAVGQPERTVELLYLPSGQVAGGHVHVRQNAVSREDRDFNVNYQGSGSYELRLTTGTKLELNPLKVDDYWEFDH